MKARIMAGVAAATLALSMGVATAAEIGGTAIMDGASPGYLQQQQQLRNEPGYSIGTGAATQRTLQDTPDYQYGDAIAQVHYMP